MGKIQLLTILILLTHCISVTKINGQDEAQAKVDFKNAPVLFREKGKAFQQVIASYRTQTPGKISFIHDGKEILKADIAKGDNRYLLTFPAVTRPKKISVSAKIDDKASEKYFITLIPPKKWHVYFVQHSHTDIGYTRPQSEILAEHMRYIDYALDYCDQTDNLPDDAKFRWTCESAWVTREYLRSRPSSQIARLKKRIEEGRIEITGMYSNMAEITDEKSHV